jgi:hypothetical protein
MRLTIDCGRFAMIPLRPTAQKKVNISTYCSLSFIHNHHRINFLPCVSELKTLKESSSQDLLLKGKNKKRSPGRNILLRIVREVVLNIMGQSSGGTISISKCPVNKLALILIVSKVSKYQCRIIL